MSVPVEELNNVNPIVDENNKPTIEMVIQFQKLVKAIQDLQDRVEALEAYHP